MGYRDDAHALRTRAAVLAKDLERAEARAEDAEQEIRELRQTIKNLRRGIAGDQLLRKDPHFTMSHGLLPVAGFFGAVITFAMPTILVPYGWQGDLDLSGAGLAFFFEQLGDGGLATVLATACALPLFALPALALIGLHLRRSWGWGLGMLGYLVWSFLCPPLGIYGLYALGRREVRDIFFSAPKVVAPEIPHAYSTPTMRVSDVDTAQLRRDEIAYIEAEAVELIEELDPESTLEAV